MPGSGPVSAPLFPPDQPLRSSSGSLLVVYFAPGPGTYVGRGVSAYWNSTHQSAELQTPLPPPHPPASLLSSPERRVRSAADLRVALADPRVESIVLEAHIRLDGRPLELISPGPLGPRIVAIASDSSACAALPPYRAAATGRPVPPGLCALDAAGSSGVLRASGPGASLSLESVALLGGAALIGGALRASGGASVTATDCLIADCSAVGDGGAAFASGASTALTFTRCAPRQRPPRRPAPLLRLPR